MKITSFFARCTFSFLSLSLLPNAGFSAKQDDDANPLVPASALPGYFAIRAKELKNPHITERDFYDVFPKQPAYRLKDVLGFDPHPELLTVSPKNPLLTGGYKGLTHFPWVLIRRSPNDVLATENNIPSIGQSALPSSSPPSPSAAVLTPTDKKFDDLQGALFSFGRDFRAKGDSWVAQGALIAPFVFPAMPFPDKKDEAAFTTWGLTPSLTFNHVETAGAPSSQKIVNQLIARAGSFAHLDSSYDNAFGFTLRAAFAYATDTTLKTRVPAGEFEFEPQIDLNPYHTGERTTPQWQIGYRSILWPKPHPDPNTDNALLAIQLRTILHIEFGDVESNGGNKSIIKGSFFRPGPVLQLVVKPLFFDHLSFTSKISYLPNVIRSEARNYLFSLGLDYALIDTPTERLSLKATYFDGGLDLTKQPANVFVLGMGAAF